ncbi:MAG: hypothetical protein K8S97_13110, partial [Anaerolineae bacterium]|nr:hypothetical protein [Anaerolineae bacterium]
VEQETINKLTGRTTTHQPPNNRNEDKRLRKQMPMPDAVDPARQPTCAPHSILAQSPTRFRDSVCTDTWSKCQLTEHSFLTLFENSYII